MKAIIMKPVEKVWIKGMEKVERVVGKEVELKEIEEGKAEELHS